MKTPKEIQLKVEQKRKEIVETSEKILKEAHEKHMCPNCNGQLPEGRRTWCSDECSYDFHMDHDYSQKSQILRDYRNELLAEYRELHPVKETQPWSTPVARKDYECSFCGLTIPKGEKSYKYTCVPGEMYFEDYPYETSRYHIGCYNFAMMICNYIDCDEGIDEDETEAVILILSFSLRQSQSRTIEMVRKGMFSGRGEEIGKYLSEYESLDYLTIGEEFTPSSDASFYLVEYGHGGIRKKILCKGYKVNEDPKNYIDEKLTNAFGAEYDGLISIKHLQKEEEAQSTAQEAVQ